MPTATISETTFDGQIYDAVQVEGPKLFNPGTYPDARGFAKLEEDKVHVRMEYRLFDSANPVNPELWPLRIFRGRKVD